jgi:hypothetical protein
MNRHLRRLVLSHAIPLAMFLAYSAESTAADISTVVRLSVVNVQVADTNQTVAGGDQFMGGLVWRLLDAGYTVVIDRSYVSDEIKRWETQAPKGAEDTARKQISYLRSCLAQGTFAPPNMVPATGVYADYHSYKNPRFTVASDQPSPDDVLTVLSVRLAKTQQYRSTLVPLDWVWVYPDVTVTVSRHGELLATEHVQQDFKSSYNAAEDIVRSIQEGISVAAYRLICKVAPAKSATKDEVRTPPTVQ